MDLALLVTGIMVVLASVAIGVIAGVYLHKLHLLLTDAENRLRQLEADIAELKSKSAPRRHTHATTAGLEDALAIAIDALHEYEDSQRYTQARITQLKEVLGILRTGPDAYDEDRPAGKRQKRRFDD